MANFGFYKNETFFKHTFKDFTVLLDLHKTDENILFSLPLYSSNVSKLLSISLLYNKLEVDSSICDNLSLNFYSYIFNKTIRTLELRFFDGYTYLFSIDGSSYKCSELDASITFSGSTATLELPGYKRLIYTNHNSKYLLTKIEGYQEDLNFSYSGDELTQITSSAYQSETISISYNYDEIVISVSRNSTQIYEYSIQHINGCLDSITCNSGSTYLWKYDFIIQNNGIAITDSDTNKLISLTKSGETYAFIDELNLTTTIQINNSYSLITDPYGQTTKYTFDNGYIYKIEKDNNVNFYYFKSKHLIVEGTLFDDFNKIGGRLTDYSIYQNSSAVSIESVLSTYPNPYYQNELGLTFNFDEDEVLVKRYFYKGRKNQPISSIIYYNLDDYDEYFGYLDFKINFFNSNDVKLLTTSPTISYSRSEMGVWRVAVLSAVCSRDYDYFEVEVKARGFYSRAYLYIDAFTCNLANTYNYQGARLVSSLVDGKPSIYSYDENHFLVGDISETISYDSNGLPILKANFLNSTVSNTFDSHNRLTSSVFSGSGFQQTISKDYPNINEEKTSDEYVTTVKQINNNNLLSSESITSNLNIVYQAKSYSYGTRNNLTSLNINNYQTSLFSYNSNQDITSLNEYSFTYTSDFLIDLVKYHSLTIADLQYDTLKRISSKTYPGYNFSFVYDNKSRISSVLLNNQNFINYTYDPFYDAVTDINDDHFEYDEHRNLVSILNNEYSRNSVIDYKSGNVFQNTLMGTQDNINCENNSSIVSAYQDLVRELSSISRFFCFFKKRMVGSSIISCFESNSENILLPLQTGSLEHKINCSMVYGKFTTYSTYAFGNKLHLESDYQFVFLFKKTSSIMSISLTINDSYSINLSFDDDVTYFSVGGAEQDIDISCLDDNFHLISINISRLGIVSLFIDDAIYSSLNFGELIHTVNQLIIPSGNEFYGILVNTNSYCLSANKLLDYKDRFDSILLRNEDNEYNFVKYPKITISNGLQIDDIDYYSFDKTYCSSKGNKPSSINHLIFNRDEDTYFVFDKAIGRFVYHSENKNLTYDVLDYTFGTVSFFIKPTESNQTLIRIGPFVLETNSQSHLVLKAGSSGTVTSWVMPSNSYSFISLSYTFAGRRCVINVYANGTNIHRSSGAVTARTWDLLIPNSKSYIKDLCVSHSVLSASEIGTLYLLLKKNIRHISYFDSENMLQIEQIRNDEGVISDTNITYEMVDNHKKPRISLKATYIDDSTISESYSYDDLGRVTSLLTEHRNSFNYDSNNRLATATYFAHTYGYTYDNKGNILTKTKDGVTTSYSYDSVYLNRLSSFGNTTFTYASNNPLFISQINKNGSVINLTYEGKNLKTYNVVNGKQITFDYNYNNLRTKKTVSINHQITEYKFYYDINNNLIKQRKIVSNEVTDELTFLRDSTGLYGLIYNGVQYLYQKDVLGTINHIIDIEGNIVVSYEYSPYGELISITGSLAETLGVINPYIYKEYYYDVETGLYWLSSRYYDPEIGRFISPDTVDYLDPTSINGLNLFAYCNNDPVNYCDPSGHFPWALLAAGLIIGALMGAGFNLGSQLVKNDFEFSEVDWGSFVNSTIVGGALGLSLALGVAYLGPVIAGVATASGNSALIAFGASTAISYIAGALGYSTEEWMNGRAPSFGKAMFNGGMVALESVVNFGVGGMIGSIGNVGTKGTPLISKEWWGKLVLGQEFTQPFKIGIDLLRKNLW